MQKISPENAEGILNSIEVVKDFRRKVTATSHLHLAHSQDESGATLILHVHGNVEESKCLATLAERLKAASDCVAKDLAEAARQAKKVETKDAKQQPPARSE